MPLPLIHQLAYSWTGWPRDGSALPPEPAPDFFASLDTAWNTDGLTRISHRWTPGKVQLTFRADPAIAPSTVAARAKGRLDHAFRQAGHRAGFARKIGLRSLGENNSHDVLRYIATQIDRADLADPRYAERLSEAAWDNPAFDLSDPSPTVHGRYWYDLHVVAVTDGRWRVGSGDSLEDIRPAVLAWGSELTGTGKGLPETVRPGVRSIAVMPDHIHLAVRGPVDRSPADLAEDLLGHLNKAAGCRLFSDRVYVGTFSVYPLAVVR